MGISVQNFYILHSSHYMYEHRKKQKKGHQHGDVTNKKCPDKESISRVQRHPIELIPCLIIVEMYSTKNVKR